MIEYFNSNNKLFILNDKIKIFILTILESPAWQKLKYLNIKNDKEYYYSKFGKTN